MTIITAERQKHLEEKAVEYSKTKYSVAFKEYYFNTLKSINALPDAEYNATEKSFLRTFALFGAYSPGDLPLSSNRISVNDSSMFTQDAEIKASVIELIKQDLLYASSQLSFKIIMVSLEDSDLLFQNNYLYKLFAKAEFDYNQADGVTMLARLLRKIKTREQISVLLLELPRLLRCDPEKFKSIDNTTILHIATATGNLELIKILVKQYPKLLHSKDIHGKNAGCYCDGSKRFTTLKVLMAQGINLHELDNFGNSVLYHVFNDIYYSKDKESETPNTTELLSQEEQQSLRYIIEEKSAKYYKNNTVTKAPLHIYAAVGVPLRLDTLPTYERMALIDKQDIEEGKTALHHAIILKKTARALELINAGANTNIKDNLGKKPLEYALLTNNVTVVNAIKDAANKNKQMLHDKSPLLFTRMEDYDFAKACYGGNDMFNTLVYYAQNHQVKQPNVNIAITKIMRNGWLDQTLLAEFSLEEQLRITTAIATAHPSLRVTAKDYAQAHILPKLVKELPPFTSGCAYGVEMELANIPHGIDANVLEWFGINVTDDGSVDHTAFMSTGALDGEELVTTILDSPQKVNLLLLASRYLHKEGALTNDSTGLHVHTNIRGSKDGNLKSLGTSINNPQGIESEQIELMLVKQVLSNWNNLEPLLLGIMRNGELYDYKDNTHSYCAPIQSFIPKLLKAKNLKEISTSMGDRLKAINLENLSPNGYGTIEFRVHDGTMHPTLIEAWLNFIHRLMQISISQVQNKIDTDTDLENFTAFKDIEQLFYILMAERYYQKTWDNKLGAPKGTLSSIAAGDKPIQVDIQNSLLYRAYQRGNEGKDYRDLLSKCPEQERASLYKEVELMLAINKQLPGILSKDVGLSNKLMASRKIAKL